MRSVPFSSWRVSAAFSATIHPHTNDMNGRSASKKRVETIKYLYCNNMRRMNDGGSEWANNRIESPSVDKATHGECLAMVLLLTIHSIR